MSEPALRRDAAPSREMAFLADAVLVKAAKAGSQQAFAELVRRHQSLVSSLAYAITRDFSESEEIAQEAFVAAWERLHQLRNDERFRAWLCRVVRVLILELRRTQRRHPDLRPLPISENIGANTVSADPSPLDRAIGREQQEFLSSALKNLHETYRVPLVLFYGEGQSIERVAEALDISPTNVRVRLTRARQMLHQHMIDLLEHTVARLGTKKELVASVMAAIALAIPDPASAAPGPDGRRPPGKKGTPPRAALYVAPAVVGGLLFLAALSQMRMQTASSSVEAPSLARLATALRPRATGAPGVISSPSRADPRTIDDEADPGQGRPGNTIFSFDFEDGVLPAVFIYGHTVPAPHGASSRYCVQPTVTLATDYPMVRLTHGRNLTLFSYSSTLVLSFDYWAAGDGPRAVQVEVYDHDKSLNYFLRREAPAQSWQHAELRLVDFVPRDEAASAMESGDSIRSLLINSSSRVGQGPFYVDNIKLVDHGPVDFPGESRINSR